MRIFLCRADDEDTRVHIDAAWDFTQLLPSAENFFIRDPKLGSNISDKYQSENNVSSASSIAADHTAGFHPRRIFQIAVAQAKDMRHLNHPEY